MKHILLITSMLTVALQMQADTRKVESLNMGWTFSYDSLFTNAREVDVPHDFQIEQPWIAPGADEKADNSDAAEE